MKLEALAWDTAFLGAPVSRILAEGAPRGELQGAVDGLRAAGVRLAYLFSNVPLPVADAEALGARLVDRKVSYRMEADGLAVRQPAPDVVPYTPDLSQADLERLAVEAGRYSRFRVDPDFPQERFIALYSEWLRKSLTGEIADAVMVVADTGRVHGLVTVAQAQGGGKIGLVAVDAACRGRGLGRQLVEAAKAWFAARGAAFAEVVTQQDNAAACRLYETCGFRVHQVQFIYHLWLRSEKG